MNKKTIILFFLVLAFLVITFLVASKNIFIVNLDATIHTFVGNHPYPAVSNLMISMTKLGNVYGASVIFIILGLFLLFKNKKYFFVFAIASSLGSLLPQIIKPLTKIQRPENILGGQDYSFPSGHATISMIFLLSSIFLLSPFLKSEFSRKLFLLLTSIIFPLVALSRIYLSVHWTTDVIAGIILGAICFIFSQIICCHKKENVL